MSCDLDTTPTKHVRRLVRGLVADHGGVVVEDAVLVADELVSNAHRHGAPRRTCRATLIHHGRRLRIEVDDTASGLPRIRPPDHSGGRGLLLVDRLASAWGVQHRAGGKTVWAELALDGAGHNGASRHLAVARARGTEPRSGGSLTSASWPALTDTSHVPT
ncbi:MULTISPECIES: ATP-binding protein [Pseudonocardiaceae]|uniref:ATP-binding protein n=1 Tax=Pseudonocardiaceae TaxID=2070 RepID=UPI0035133E7F